MSYKKTYILLTDAPERRVDDDALRHRGTSDNVLNELSASAPTGSKGTLYATKLAMKTESRRKTSPSAKHS